MNTSKIFWKNKPYLESIFLRFSNTESTRANYARGEDTYDPVLSKAVVFPETNEEVSKILSLSLIHI